MNLQVAAFAVLSFHVLQVYGLTSNNQCGDSSTQLALCRFDQQEYTLNVTDIFCKSLQEDNSRCFSDGKDQLCVEVCTNNTDWETAVCKTSASVYHHLTQCQCTPGNLSVSQNMTDSYSVTLTWSQSLCNYSISCCPAPYNMTSCISSNFDERQDSATIIGLKPFTSYDCCVWSIHGDVKVQQMCRRVQTTEAAPDPPTNLTGYQVNSTALLLAWKPPAVKNGEIQSYHIKIYDLNDEQFVLNKSTDSDVPYAYDVTDHILTQDHRYNFSVAARTKILGKFSDATMIMELSINPLSQEGMKTLELLPLSFAIGLLSLILIIVAIVAAIICNRMRKQNKSLTREIQEYEMTSKYSAVRHDTGSLPDRYLAIKKRDSNRKQPLYPPAHLAADYITPTMTRTTGPIEEKKTEEKVKMDESQDTHSEDKEKTKTNETCDKNSEENPYQSLIVSRTDNTTPTPEGYIKITRSRVGTLEEGTLPPKSPPVPSKPEPDYSPKSLIPHLSLASDLPPKSENMYASRSETS